MNANSVVAAGLLLFLLGTTVADDSEIEHVEVKGDDDTPDGGEDDVKHRYAVGDEVPLYGNKIGPFANPSEHYEYFKLPFCQPNTEERKAHGLGEVLSGNRHVKTMYDIKFQESVSGASLCEQSLSASQVQEFRDAIDDDFYFEMVFDSLPIWGFIGGKIQNSFGDTVRADQGGASAFAKYSLYTHSVFTILYNDDRVIDVQWAHDAARALDISGDGDVKVKWSYSVTWVKSDVSFEDRLVKFRHSFLQQNLEIHWFSITNSLITVMLLLGFLATILLRIVRRDLVKYTLMSGDSDDDEEGGGRGAAEEEDEIGWKLLHGDVFRMPPHPNVFSAVVGNGVQMFILSFGLILLAVGGTFYPYVNRGASYTAAIVLYAITSIVNGYSSSKIYNTLDGKNWVRATMTTILLFTPLMFFVVLGLNFVAIAYESSAALPFGTIVVILLIWILVSVPLTVLGSIAGRHFATPFTPPCRTSVVPREVPSAPWFRSGFASFIMSGFLPFSAIYIELYYLLGSLWGHRTYTIYGILLIVFTIAMLVVSFITIAHTYFQLASENHRWWWPSIWRGGSVGFFVWIYCIFYYYKRSEMSGFMQGSFFFGYMTLVCFGLSLMCAMVGFLSSFQFVHYIYSRVKVD